MSDLHSASIFIELLEMSPSIASAIRLPIRTVAVCSSDLPSAPHHEPSLRHALCTIQSHF